MGEATGGSVERKWVCILANTEAAKQAQSKESTQLQSLPGTVEHQTRWTSKAMVRQDFTDNLGQTATGYLWTATVVISLEVRYDFICQGKAIFSDRRQISFCVGYCRDLPSTSVEICSSLTAKRIQESISHSLVKKNCEKEDFPAVVLLQ